MPAAVYILFGAAFTAAVSLALGGLLLRACGARLYREEERLLGFVTGAACLSLLTFLLCAAGIARKGVFFGLGCAVLAVAVRRGALRPLGKPLPPVPPLWRWIFRSLFAVFSVMYFFHAMAPEMSPDGVSYHLGLVARYQRAHGFERITTNMYANLSQGIELLFLFAFAFGRHSAAALTHFAFLVTLPLLMLGYARRFGFPVAGVCGALLVFASPVVGMDGSVAYNDVATACVIFAAFCLARIWAAEPANSGLLAPLGLVAGFGYAAKYTAFLAVPYALAVVGWRSLRSREPAAKRLLIVSACAALMIAPWMIRNAVWLNNPLSPFFNKWFPNPYVHVSFEEEYSEYLRNYGLKNRWEIPLEVTVRGGALGGLLGPMFLLAPIGLIALRSPAGRSLLAAGLLFALPYPANIGTRFLLPALPFVALSMGLAVAGSKPAALILTFAHALFSLPAAIDLYARPDAWRMEPKIPIKQALRIETEDSYLNFKMPSYGTARIIDRLTPAGARVFTFSGLPEAYTSREIVSAYQSSYGHLIRDILWTPLVDGYQPNWMLRFRYPRQRLRRLRAVQTASGSSEQWSVSEFRVYRGETELFRAPEWKLRASPNPWDVQLAFDNSPVTRWRSYQGLYAGMEMSIEFPRPVESDAVLLESAHDQYQIKLKLEGMDQSGAWKTLSEAPEASDIPPRLGLRRAATFEAKQRGIDYLVVFDFDFNAADFRDKARIWGLTPIAEHGGSILYRLE
jgi:hypothetical protein